MIPAAEKNLLVVPRPGDEIILYGFLVWKNSQAEWHALLVFDDLPSPQAWEDSIAAMGIAQGKRLQFPVLPPTKISIKDLGDALAPYVGGYKKVYVPDATAGGSSGVIAAAVAATGVEGIVTRTTNGPPDEIAIATRADWQLMLNHLNCFYGMAIQEGRMDMQSLSSSSTYRHVSASAIARFWAQYSNWNQSAGSDDDPWDLLSSDYERRRHALELEVISGMDWEEMVEIGACVGAFTQMVLEKFPQRRLTAVEPTAEFAEKLAVRTKCRVNVIRSPAHEVREAFDLVLISSAAYYMQVWPVFLIDMAKRYIVTSHKTEYEERVVVPALQSSGWTRIGTRSLAPCFEEFCGFTVEKDGTTVSTWAKPPAI